MSQEQKFITILIAEDNVVSRELMAGILKPHGYNVLFADDGGQAIEVMGQNVIDLAYVDLNMSPKGGFELIKHMVARNIKIPVVIITSSTSGDVLLRANELGVEKVFQKPIDPERFLEVTRRILKRYGHNTSSFLKETHEASFSNEALMDRAVMLARRNIETKKGGPFGAVVADQTGKILGEGTNGVSSRIDPTAHAEIRAIRHAAEQLERADLSDCILYCSNEPTMMGKALIASVGISSVYYGLAHADTGVTRETNKAETTYEQLSKEAALEVFQQWQSLSDEDKARLKD